ncbi:MAG TPA: NAD(P)/FAD-dependent oxidoreductase [Gammaproteobacteria bacterium]|nr:NAD(P)/FAD-dependent oxidoreductase [Gammaproteobacteria bacterium]
MECCDALIVGGGPAGSTCARQLCQAGLDVVVMDKHRFPRDKVCAGWITPGLVDELDLNVADYQRGRVWQPIKNFRTGLIDGPAVFTAYDQVVSYGILRRQFDDYLLRRAGARLRLGEAVKTLQRQGNDWIVNGVVRTPLLIGAGGHFCPVARRLGAGPGRDEPIIAAQEVEFPLSPAQAARCGAAGDTPELYFCHDLKGYGWCFRKGDYLNIGLGREDSHQLPRHVAAFLGFLVQRGTVPDDASQHFKGHAYLLYTQRRPRPLVADGALLIGDAAGLAHPQSGEGIRPAVQSALIAAAAVAAARGDYRRARLAAYPRDMSALFGPRRGKVAFTAHLPPGLSKWLAARLLASPWFSRRVLLDRWFLHRQQAPVKVTGGP